MAPPWFRFTTPLYKNTGSVARDHLASERTFLAWMRTGLGFVALGIAIERFSQLDLSELIPDHQHYHHQISSIPLPPSPPPPQQQHQEPEKQNHNLAQQSQAQKVRRDTEKQAEKRAAQLQVGVLLSLGAGSILYGATRYFGTMRHLERGEFRPAYHGAAVLAAAVAGLAGGVYGSTIRRVERERGDL